MRCGMVAANTVTDRKSKWQAEGLLHLLGSRLELILQAAQRRASGSGEPAFKICLIEDIIRADEQADRTVLFQRNSVTRSQVYFVQAAEAIGLRHCRAVNRVEIAGGIDGVERQHEARGCLLGDEYRELVPGNGERLQHI